MDIGCDVQSECLPSQPSLKLNKHSTVLGWLRFATPTRPRHAVDGAVTHGFHVINKVSCDQSSVSRLVPKRILWCLANASHFSTPAKNPKRTTRCDTVSLFLRTGFLQMPSVPITIPKGRVRECAFETAPLPCPASSFSSTGSPYQVPLV